MPAFTWPKKTERKKKHQRGNIYKYIEGEIKTEDRGSERSNRKRRERERAIKRVQNFRINRWVKDEGMDLLTGDRQMSQG